MKKLMIAAAIVCAAAYVQAAQSINWSYSVSSPITRTDGTGLWTGYGTLTCDTLGYSFNSADYGVPLIADGAFTVGLEITGESDTDYTFKLSLTDGSYTYTQNGVGRATGKFGSVTFAGGNAWTLAPEPTSGLLMLLGMAGLAFKRKRA